MVCSDDSILVLGLTYCVTLLITLIFPCPSFWTFSIIPHSTTVCSDVPLFSTQLPLNLDPQLHPSFISHTQPLLYHHQYYIYSSPPNLVKSSILLTHLDCQTRACSRYLMSATLSTIDPIAAYYTLIPDRV
ncbi:hypothetical protein NXS19_001833 [Fusarium pseudograminearum]|nr:hypothetical protein NXS19_001833 [Fusarium pseudograminearum]